MSLSAPAPTADVRAPAPVPLRSADGRDAADLFDLDPALRHLNHGSFGSPPRAATEHQQRLRQELLGAPVRWFAGAPERIAAARAAVAPLLGLAADDFAFVANASAGASVLFGSLDLPRGAEIVVTDHGYGAVVMGAERLARRIGGRVVTAAVDLAASAEESAAAVIGAFTDRTVMVIVDQITSSTARALPVGVICRAARERGIVSVVDGAHAPLLVTGAVQEADADHWFGNLHKFGCAPQGTAVLVPRPGLGDELYPVVDSWGALMGFPDRFDHQGTVDSTPWLAAATAIGEIEEQFGWAQVRDYVGRLADHAEELISTAMSAAVGSDRRVDVGMPVTALRLVRLPAGIATTTDEANALRDLVLFDLGIEAAFTSFRGQGYLRFSAHVYNTPDDYRDFAERAVPYLDRLSRNTSAAATGGAHPSGGEQ